MRTFGGLWGLINNAAAPSHDGTVVTLALDDWNREIAVSLTGAFLMSKFAVPHMLGKGGSIVHVAHAGPYGQGFPCLIGEGVTIGHAAVVHACTISDYCLIGMHASVLDGAVVKKYGFVGAGALIPPGKVVGERELWLGNPAKFVRLLSDRQIEHLHYSADHYVRLKDEYLASA